MAVVAQPEGRLGAAARRGGGAGRCLDGGRDAALGPGGAAFLRATRIPTDRSPRGVQGRGLRSRAMRAGGWGEPDMGAPNAAA